MRGPQKGRPTGSLEVGRGPLLAPVQNNKFSKPRSVSHLRLVCRVGLAPVPGRRDERDASSTCRRTFPSDFESNDLGPGQPGGRVLSGGSYVGEVVRHFIRLQTFSFQFPHFCEATSGPRCRRLTNRHLRRMPGLRQGISLQLARHEGRDVS